MLIWVFYGHIKWYCWSFWHFIVFNRGVLKWKCQRFFFLGFFHSLLHFTFINNNLLIWPIKSILFINQFKNPNILSILFYFYSSFLLLIIYDLHLLLYFFLNFRFWTFKWHWYYRLILSIKRCIIIPLFDS